ncbi:MAG TPA: metalloregulator ArsR/SmtB family transcription factor [Thermoanaerobaculia bacterium]|nr:metalloregulator ArsR/SmtB family transcription factor [Thermoanaerobaculia bacterium]
MALAALADPTRRSILELLRDGPVTVAELADKVPVSRPAVSQHLAVLRDARLVTHEKAGTKHLYRADPAGLEALRRYLEGVWGGMLSQFAEAAESENKRTRSGKPAKSQSKRRRRHDDRGSKT